MVETSGKTPERKRLAKNIRINRGAIEAQVSVFGKWHSKRFPLGTPLHFVQAWVQTIKHNAMVAKVEKARARQPRPIPAVPRDETAGYCYIYFIRAGLNVKIGKALDPDSRMMDLQVGHPQPLSMLAAIPAHSSLERIIHSRFAHLRGTGEWFHLGDDLQDFIAALQLGKNPVELLWADLVYVGARRTRRKPINILTTPVDKVDAILGTNGGSHEPTRAHD